MFLQNSARRNVPRVMTSHRRSGQTQVHGLVQMEPLTEGTEEINLPKVEEVRLKKIRWSNICLN